MTHQKTINFLCNYLLLESSVAARDREGKGRGEEKEESKQHRTILKFSELCMAMHKKRPQKQNKAN